MRDGVRRTGRWPASEPGPTATGAQRARRRRTEPPAGRALVFSRRPPGGVLADALAAEGLETEWTDSGPGAIGEAVARDLALCVIGVGRDGEQALDYLPCLNQAAPGLPVVVVNDRDSLETQRKVRSHKVFYYLLEPLDSESLREVLRAALGRLGLPSDPG